MEKVASRCREMCYFLHSQANKSYSTIFTSTEKKKINWNVSVERLHNHTLMEIPFRWLNFRISVQVFCFCYFSFSFLTFLRRFWTVIMEQTNKFIVKLVIATVNNGKKQNRMPSDTPTRAISFMMDFVLSVNCQFIEQKLVGDVEQR